MKEDQTMRLFLKITQHRLYHHYLPKLVQSINKVTMSRLWEHESAHLNSIGGIVLHICEHVKRSDAKYFKTDKVEISGGIEEHFPDKNMSPELLINMVENIIGEWNKGIERRINGSEMEGTVLPAPDIHHFYHLIEHIGYHLGQIIDRVQRLTGESFKFCQNGINERNLRSLIEGNQ